MTAWQQNGSEIHCHTCDVTFRVGHSCNCVTAPPVPTPTTPELAGSGAKSLSPPESASSLLTPDGVLNRMAALCGEVREAVDGLEVKRAEAELKILRAIMDVATKREAAARLESVEQKLRDLESALAHARGFAGRLDQSPVGIN